MNSITASSVRVNYYVSPLTRLIAAYNIYSPHHSSPDRAAGLEVVILLMLSDSEQLQLARFTAHI